METGERPVSKKVRGTQRIYDEWKGLSKYQIAENRLKGKARYKRRWRDGVGREAPERSQMYREDQLAQAKQDELRQLSQPRSRQIAASSVTVGTLLDRHLAAKADRATKTVATDTHHAGHARSMFGDRVVATLDTTEIEV